MADQNNPQSNIFTLFNSIKGINNVDNPNSDVFQPGDKPPYVVDAKNVDVYRDGVFKTRRGYIKKRTLTKAHSGDVLLNKFYYVDNGTIYKYQEGQNSDLVIKSGLNPNLEVSFATIDNQIFWSNSEVCGRIVNNVSTFWGLDQTYPPVLTQTSTGSLHSGVYLVSVAAVADGIESGSYTSSSITLTSDGGIDVSINPSNIDTNATSLNVYVSDTNGNNLYLNKNVPVGNFSINNQSDKITLFTGLNVSPPPPGHIVREFNGFIFIASNNILYFSEPNGYHRFRLNTDAFVFDSRIVLVEHVSTGLYVATENEGTYYLSGYEPKKFRRVHKCSKRVSEGKALRVPIRKFPWIEVDYDEEVPVWITEDGYAIGGQDGWIRYPTDARVAMDSTKKSTLTYVERPGLRQILTSLKDKISESKMQTTDNMVLSVTRNGVPLN